MKLERNKFYTLLIRPVVIVTTISEDGKVNAAPFSFNTPISFSPPLYGFSCNPRHDTWTNIQKTKEFVVNVAGKELGNYLHILERDYPYGVNELEEAGLAELPSKKVKPPRVKDALAWIECEAISHFEIGDHIWVVGHVLEVEVRDDAWDNVIDAGRALCHISGKYFAQDSEIKEYKRA
jgi:flavin reductase (DIM6/NTAB) family NADH-FMN oxidoreductase RutF